MPHARHIALYRILYHTIFALVLYFYIAFTSRNITSGIFLFLSLTSAANYRDTCNIRLFNMKFFSIFSILRFELQRVTIILQLNDISVHVPRHFDVDRQKNFQINSSNTSERHFENDTPY